MGSHGPPGTKLLSISGDCRKPGVYEVPFGITARELLEMAEAENAGAMLIGGPVRPDDRAGTLRRPDLLRRPGHRRLDHDLQPRPQHAGDRGALPRFLHRGELRVLHPLPGRADPPQEGGAQGGRAARASRPTWTTCATCRTSSSGPAAAASARPHPTRCWERSRISATSTPGLWRSESRGCCRTFDLAQAVVDAELRVGRQSKYV